MLQMRYSPELIESRVERTVRCKITGQVDFSSRLKMPCNETDGARKFWWQRYYRPTWHDLESPSQLESTWSTRLPSLRPSINHPTRSQTHDISIVSSVS